MGFSLGFFIEMNFVFKEPDEGCYTSSGADHDEWCAFILRTRELRIFDENVAVEFQVLVCFVHVVEELAGKAFPLTIYGKRDGNSDFVRVHERRTGNRIISGHDPRTCLENV